MKSELQTTGSDESLFVILARNARERSPMELWTTAVGGAMNTAFVWWQFPALRWVAAGFAAVAAYGIGGLSERLLATRGADHGGGWRNKALIVVRSVALVGGLAAAAGAVLGFMAAALHGWQH
ncbi:MAG TPA: hypothetical protein VI259_11345 [Gemmatimonadaceae bacterium]